LHREQDRDIAPFATSPADSAQLEGLLLQPDDGLLRQTTKFSRNVITSPHDFNLY